MSLYHVGDRVVVRDDLKYDVDYYNQDGVVHDIVVTDMMEFCGKVVTISSVSPKLGKYSIKELPCYNWCDSMFEGLEEDVYNPPQPENVPAINGLYAFM